MNKRVFNALRKIAADVAAPTPAVRIKVDKLGDMSGTVLTAKVGDEVAGHLSIHPRKNQVRTT